MVIISQSTMTDQSSSWGISWQEQKRYTFYFRSRSSQALKMDSMRLIAVPFYDSLSIRRNWQDIRKLYPDITSYFPDYDPEYMPSRKFFLEIFASLHYEDAKIMFCWNSRPRLEAGFLKINLKFPPPPPFYQI